MSDLADKLIEAVNEKENDVNRWTWKQANGVDIRMMDMTPQMLIQAYKHADEMLNNDDIRHPGNIRKKLQIDKMWGFVNSELLRRFIIHECNIESLQTNKDVIDYINVYKSKTNIKNSDYVTAIFDGLPEIFTNVTIDSLLSACLDLLPAFNHWLISDKFILSLGIWLTNAEKKELTEYDENGNFRNWKDVIKERLILNNVNLHFNSSGITYSEFRALVKIRSGFKYSAIPTDTLKLLRDKILLLLSQNTQDAIDKWQSLKIRLKTVADLKSVALNDN